MQSTRTTTRASCKMCSTPTMACATSAPRQTQTHHARRAQTPPTVAEVDARRFFLSVLMFACATFHVPRRHHHQRLRGRHHGLLEGFNAMIQICPTMPNTETTTRVTWQTMACATSDQNTCPLHLVKPAPIRPIVGTGGVQISLTAVGLIFACAHRRDRQTADDSARRLIDAPNTWRYGCRGRTHHLARGRCASTSRPRHTRQTCIDSLRARAPIKSTTPRDDLCLCAHSPTMTRRSASRA